jgi:hypothetical protein
MISVSTRITGYYPSILGPWATGSQILGAIGYNAGRDGIRPRDL